MKKIILPTALLLLICCYNFAFPLPPAAIKTSQQLVLVITNNWNDVSGKLWRFQRGKNGKWNPIDKPFAVVVGKKGMAWATAKIEGDLKSPAGIFYLTMAFGFAKKPNKHLKMHYIPITENTICVDDYRSKYYNQVIDKNGKKEDWNSAEQMRAIKVYQYGLIVDYNSNKTPHAGSCIFMHIWENAKNGTAGCTAMQKSNLKKLLFWLNAKDKPILVQLTAGQYQKLQNKWHLPLI